MNIAASKFPIIVDFFFGYNCKSCIPIYCFSSFLGSSAFLYNKAFGWNSLSGRI